MLLSVSVARKNVLPLESSEAFPPPVHSRARVGFGCGDLSDTAALLLQEPTRLLSRFSVPLLPNTRLTPLRTARNW
jgi:hypothetical protein